MADEKFFPDHIPQWGKRFCSITSIFIQSWFDFLAIGEGGRRVWIRKVSY
jgi:hypothetical protein